MAIPIANLQKQIQIPQVAKGQALDLSKNVEVALSPALNTLENMEKFANVWGKAAYAKERADDQFNAEQATLKYMQKADELNKQLAKKQGTEALKFKDKYYSELTKAQEVFLGEISSLKNADIRENARDGINKFNLSNSANQDMYFYKQEEFVKDGSSDAIAETASMAALSAVSPMLNAEQNVKVFNDALQKGADSKANRLIEKGYPPELINIKIQEYKKGVADKVADRLAADARKFGFLTGYKSSLDFLNSLGKEIATDDKIELLKKYEKLQLDYEFKKDPSKFTTDDNKFNEAFAATIAPNLRPDERWQTITIAKTGKENGLSDRGTAVATAEANKLTDKFFKSLSALGIVPQEELKEISKDLLAVGGKDAKKALEKRLLEKFKNKGTLAATIRLFNDFKNFATAQYAINTESGEITNIKGMSQAQIEDLKKNGRTEIVNDIFAFSTDLKNGVIDIQKIMEPVIDQLVTVYEGKSGMKVGFWEGRKLNVEEQSTMALMTTLYELGGKDFEKIPVSVLLDAQSDFLNHFDIYMQEEVEETENGVKTKKIKTIVNLEQDATTLFEDTKKRKFVGATEEMTYADRLRQLMAFSLNENIPNDLRPKQAVNFKNWGPQEFNQKSHAGVIMQNFRTAYYGSEYDPFFHY